MNSKNESNNLEKNWELVNFCEFDKYATKSYCAIHNADESKNLGDITKVDETELDDFNMICGGSPCQDFSVAGKQKGSVWTCKDCEHEYNPLTVHWSRRDKCPNCGSENIEKTRSSLLVEYLRVVRANKPNFGIYENVKNIVGKQFKDTTFNKYNKMRQNILENCDVLVDGRYIDELRDITLKWRGSSNQRVIDVKRSLKQGKVILWENQ